MSSFESQFGRWTFNTKTAALETVIAPATGAIYQIRLEEMRNSAQTLDWIYQVAEKTWASASDIGDLVRAISYIFGRDVCSGGVDKVINTEEILSKRFGINIAP